MTDCPGLQGAGRDPTPSARGLTDCPARRIPCLKIARSPLKANAFHRACSRFFARPPGRDIGLRCEAGRQRAQSKGRACSFPLRQHSVRTGRKGASAFHQSPGLVLTEISSRRCVPHNALRQREMTRGAGNAGGRKVSQDLSAKVVTGRGAVPHVTPLPQDAGKIAVDWPP